VSGAIASEPEFDVDEKPAMYIDCRTNRGSSGSPVFMVAIGTNTPLDGDPIGGAASMTTRTTSGQMSASFPMPVHRFIGIYSGRVNENADIGYLWREEVIRAICENVANPQSFSRTFLGCTP
jgi:hypothetical protein